MKYSLTIGWLYPELMSTYGDRGNIIVLQKRCQWRGIDVEVKYLDLGPASRQGGFKIEDLRSCDLLFMGGAQDRQQKIVAEDLRKKAKALREMIENGIPGLYICGAYQFLGKYYKILGEQSAPKNFASSAYKEADGTVIKGLDILDLYTEHPGENSQRLIGNVVIELGSWFMVHGRDTMNNELQAKRTHNYLVGFENHGGRTYLGKGAQPLGKVMKGFGNNGDQPRLDGGQAGDKTEGAIYKNSFGSYLHGPILPKNPHLADLLIKLALEKKYGGDVKLKKLDDSLELQAHKAVFNRFFPLH